MSSKLNKHKLEAIVGIPWYSERSWKNMKEIAEDPENFYDSFQIWLARADKSVVLLTNRGKAFERLNIDPISYSWWCENHSVKRNKESRRTYIQYLLTNKINQK